ncbi:hypothetical protein PC119_g25225 [Phytophthora cactorum]|uniref:Uncharacterized protein n=1 Tax=Phytophthora cactorum TaxID=29920 RepID=A0A8T1AWY5_9STRA|nr:hypothetical protein PC117_g24092 [Phytophthora cactorum]KAG2964512.1 hypothetical protein PC119_g25225 [Phytophthora cactorum]
MSSSPTLFTSGDAESASVISHTCAIAPSLTSRRKFFQERPGSRVIDCVSQGGLATSMVRRHPEAPSTYSSTQTDSVGDLSLCTSSRRGINRRRFDFFFRRLDCELEDESHSLDDEPMLDCHLVQRKEPMLNRRRIIDLALPRGIIVQQHRNKKQI